MITLRDVSFRFAAGGFHLQIPALDIDAKSHVAFAGPSGSGKTTILNLVAGILVPSSGEVLVKDCVVSALSDQQRRAFRLRNIGFVFQNFDLINYLSVKNNILVAARIDPTLSVTDALRSRAQNLAVRMGIGDKLDSYPGMLSQGEQQRVAIVRALLLQPQIILADEATGNLDPDNKQAVMDLLIAEARMAGATLVAVTHDHELLERFDRVLDFRDLLVARC